MSKLTARSQEKLEHRRRPGRTGQRESEECRDYGNYDGQCKLEDEGRDIRPDSGCFLSSAELQEPVRASGGGCVCGCVGVCKLETLANVRYQRV